MTGSNGSVIVVPLRPLSVAVVDENFWDGELRHSCHAA